MLLDSAFGSDYITITDEDGHEYELEVLNTLEYNGCNYLAVIPADSNGQDLRRNPGVCPGYTAPDRFQTGR